MHAQKSCGKCLIYKVSETERDTLTLGSLSSLSLTNIMTHHFTLIWIILC